MRTAARSGALSIWEPVPSEDVAREVLVLDDVAQALAHARRVDDDGLAAALGRIEGDVVEEALEDGVEAAGADVLGALVHLRGDLGDLGDRVLGEGEVHALGLEER